MFMTLVCTFDGLWVALNLTDDMGPKIVSDMRQGCFSLVTGNTAISLATVTCYRGVSFLNLT